MRGEELAIVADVNPWQRLAGRAFTVLRALEDLYLDKTITAFAPLKTERCAAIWANAGWWFRRRAVYVFDVARDVIVCRILKSTPTTNGQ